MSAASVSRWLPVRKRLAALVVLLAAATAAAAAAIGGTQDHAIGAVAYIAAAVVALFSRVWITVQVIGGQIVTGGLLLGGRIGVLAAMPFVAAVIVTAELLAAVIRLDSPLPRRPAADLRRAGTAAAIGAAVFAAVALATRLPAPAGLPAIGLGAAGCLVLAIVLVRAGLRAEQRMAAPAPSDRRTPPRS